MRPADTTRLALQALKRYPLRTAMLLVAIAIGVAAVVMLTAVGEGARRYVTGEFAALGTNLLVVMPGRAETAGAGGPGMLVGATARDLTLEDAMALARNPRITRIAPVVLGSGIASWRGRERDITVLGTTSDLLDIQHLDIERGRFLPRTDLDLASPVCVLGHRVRAELFGAAGALGQWLRIGETRCRVIGVLSQLGLTGAFHTDETIFLPIANAQQLFNSAGVFRILLEVDDRAALERTRQSVIRIIKARHQGEEDVTVVTQDAVIATFNEIFRMVTLALAGIAAISLVVAGVLIMNVMLVAVSQRTAEIGLLKALGARQAEIAALFLTEAACLSLLGSISGALLGQAGALALGAMFPILEFRAPSWAWAAAVAVALTSGLVFAVLPARRAARLDPVAALARH